MDPETTDNAETYTYTSLGDELIFSDLFSQVAEEIIIDGQSQEVKCDDGVVLEYIANNVEIYETTCNEDSNVIQQISQDVQPCAVEVVLDTLQDETTCYDETNVSQQVSAFDEINATDCLMDADTNVQQVIALDEINVTDCLVDEEIIVDEQTGKEIVVQVQYVDGKFLETGQIENATFTKNMFYDSVFQQIPSPLQKIDEMGEQDANVTRDKESPTYQRSFEKHMKKLYPKDGKTYKCRQCNQQFSTLPALSNHNKTVHNQITRRHICEFCSKSFVWQCDLKRHSRLCPQNTKTKQQQKAQLQQETTKTKNSGDVNSSSKKLYACDFCSKSFIYRSQLKIHIRKHTREGGKKQYDCIYCSKSFEYMSFLQNHLRKHTGQSGKKQFICNYCFKTFDYNSHLKIHLGVHTGEKPKKQFNCNFCSKSFGYKSHLEIHLRRHTGEAPAKKYNCQFCSKAFGYNSHLLLHLKTHTGEGHKNQYNCNFCNKTFGYRSHLDTHLRIHTGERPFSCSSCEKAFKTKGELVLHHQSNHSEQPRLECYLCEKTFKNNVYLRIHQKRCNNSSFRYKSTHTCSDCEATFISRKALVTHRKTEHKHICEYCSKTFENSGTLQRHMGVHTGERPFLCSICDVGFKDKKAFNTHKEIHSVPGYLCELCSRTFTRMKALKSHMKSHFKSHSKQTSECICSWCKRTFKYESALKKHKHWCQQAKDCYTEDFSNETNDLLQESKENESNDNNDLFKGPTTKSPRRLVCYWCQKTFKHIQYFRKHQKTCNSSNSKGIRKYTCPDCTATFISQKALLTHRKTTHKHVCEICSKTFENSMILERHLGVHTGERPFLCAICDVGFKNKLKLQKHNEIHLTHRDRPYLCELCSKTFTDMKSLKSHIQTHSDERKSICCWCNKSYKDEKALKNHKFWCHPEHRKMASNEQAKDCHNDVSKEANDELFKESDISNDNEFFKGFKRESDESNDCHNISTKESDDDCINDLLRELNDERNKDFLIKSNEDNKDLLKESNNHNNSDLFNGFKRESDESNQMNCKNISSKESHDDLLGELGHESKKDLLIKSNEDGNKDLQSEKVDCETCCKRFKNNDNLIKHFLVKHCNDSSHNCPLCEKPFNTMSKLKKHQKTHLKEYGEDYCYRCSYCERAFKDKRRWREHERRHVDPDYRRDRPVRKHVCEICSMKFADFDHYQRHLRAHTAERPWVCDICGKAYMYSPNLNRHLQIAHSKEKVKRKLGRTQHTCEVCNKSFRCISVLERHMIVHQKSEYVCEFCNKKFKLPAQLNRHRLVHIQGRRYSCHLCENAYFHPSHLKRHLANNHTEKRLTKVRFCCKFCNKTFKHEYLSKYHQKMHLQEKFKGNNKKIVLKKSKTLCKICHKSFERFNKLIIHLRRVHQTERNFRKSGVKPNYRELSGKISDLVEHARKSFRNRKSYRNSQIKNCNLKKADTSANVFECIVSPLVVCKQNLLDLANTIEVNEVDPLNVVCEETKDTSIKLKTDEDLKGSILIGGDNAEDDDEVNDIENNTDHRKSSANVRTKKGEKKYVCEICSMKFTKFLYYKRHKKLHSVKRPFPCNLCNNAYLQRAHLNRHLANSHSNKQDALQMRKSPEKQYICKFCNESFIQISQLESHLTKHAAIKQIYPCTLCKKTFKHEFLLKYHQRKHLELQQNGDTKTLTKKICLKSFDRLKKLRNHLRRLHKTERNVKQLTRAVFTLSNPRNKSDSNINKCPRLSCDNVETKINPIGNEMTIYSQNIDDDAEDLNLSENNHCLNKELNSQSEFDSLKISDGFTLPNPINDSDSEIYSQGLTCNNIEAKINSTRTEIIVNDSLNIDDDAEDLNLSENTHCLNKELISESELHTTNIRTDFTLSNPMYDGTSRPKINSISNEIIINDSQNIDDIAEDLNLAENTYILDKELNSDSEAHTTNICSDFTLPNPINDSDSENNKSQGLTCNKNKTKIHAIRTERIISDSQSIEDHLEDSDLTPLNPINDSDSENNKSQRLTCKNIKTNTNPIRTERIISDSQSIEDNSEDLNLSENTQGSDKEHRYHCSKCKIIYKDKRSLKNHQRIHLTSPTKKVRDPNKFICEICSLGFTQYIYYQKHLNIHSIDRPFPCTLCDKGYLQRWHLKRHLKNSHSKDEAAALRMLKKHLTYSCHLCERTYKYEHLLKFHQKIKHFGQQLNEDRIDLSKKNEQRSKSFHHLRKCCVRIRKLRPTDYNGSSINSIDMPNSEDISEDSKNILNNSEDVIKLECPIDLNEQVCVDNTYILDHLGTTSLIDLSKPDISEEDNIFANNIQPENKIENSTKSEEIQTNFTATDIISDMNNQIETSYSSNNYETKDLAITQAEILKDCEEDKPDVAKEITNLENTNNINEVFHTELDIKDEPYEPITPIHESATPQEPETQTDNYSTCEGERETSLADSVSWNYLMPATKKDYSCSLCKRNFQNDLTLKYHQKSHLQGDANTGSKRDLLKQKKICRHCFKFFEGIDALKNHIRRSHNIKANDVKKPPPSPQPLNSCAVPEKSQSVLVNHVQNNFSDGELQTESFSDKQSVNKNCVPNKNVSQQLANQENDKNVCIFCSKKFATPRNLRRHYKIHARESNSSCFDQLNENQSLIEMVEIKEKLIKSGENSEILKNSQLTSIEEEDDEKDDLKATVCKFCSKSFSSPHNLRRHHRVHTGERPFSCSLCNKSYKDKRNLIIHQNRCEESPIELAPIHEASNVDPLVVKLKENQDLSENVWTKNHLKISVDIFEDVGRDLMENPANTSLSFDNVTDETRNIKHTDCLEQNLKVNETQNNVELLKYFENSEDIQSYAAEEIIYTENIDRIIKDTLCYIITDVELLEKKSSAKSLEDSFSESGYHPCADEESCNEALQYQCSNCKEIFYNKLNIEIHVNKFKSETCDKFCQFCFKSFASNDIFDSHLQEHTGKPPWFCNLCEISFDDVRGLNDHQKIHMKEEFNYCQHLKDHEKQVLLLDLKCAVCNQIFTFKRDLIKHVRQFHKNEQAFKCRDCREQFFKITDLLYHSKFHKKLTKIRACKRCLKSINKDHSYDGKPLKAHDADRPYACRFCENTYKEEKHLMMHKNSKHLKLESKIKNKYRIACKLCCEIFDTFLKLKSHNLKKHKKKHKNLYQRLHKKEHNCTFGEQIFKDDLSWTRHQNIHSNLTQEIDVSSKVCEQTDELSYDIEYLEDFDYEGDSDYANQRSTKDNTNENRLLEDQTKYCDMDIQTSEEYKSKESNYVENSKNLESIIPNNSRDSHHNRYTAINSSNALNKTKCVIQISESDILKDKSLKASTQYLEGNNAFQHKAVCNANKCAICNQVFKYQQDLLEHVKNMHPNFKGFKCRDCGAILSNFELFLQHMSSHKETT